MSDKRSPPRPKTDPFGVWLDQVCDSRVPRLTRETLSAKLLEIDRDGDGYAPSRISAWVMGDSRPDPRQWGALVRALALTSNEEEHGEKLWRAAWEAGLGERSSA